MKAILSRLFNHEELNREEAKTCYSISPKAGIMTHK